MKSLIQNIIANSKDSKMLRKDIFNYFESNKDIKRINISKAISELLSEGIIISREVKGEFYDVVEYELSEEMENELLKF